MTAVAVQRKVFVSGSTSGIGFAIARSFAESGAKVFIHGRTRERVDAAIAALKSDLPEADLVAAPGSLQSPEDVQAIAKVTGDIDVLVNNAGIFSPAVFEESSDELWNSMWQTNVMTGVRLSRQFVPGMKQRGWGRVVFVSSESALQPTADMIHYAASKAAQLAVARGIAEDASCTGVTVNVVLPGPTMTEGVRDLMQTQALDRGLTVADVESEYMRRDYPQSLIGRLATAAEVASVVAFLGSHASSAVSGSAFRVDGGVLRPIV